VPKPARFASVDLSRLSRLDPRLVQARMPIMTAVLERPQPAPEVKGRVDGESLSTAVGRSLLNDVGNCMSVRHRTSAGPFGAAQPGLANGRIKITTRSGAMQGVDMQVRCCGIALMARVGVRIKVITAAGEAEACPGNAAIVTGIGRRTGQLRTEANGSTREAESMSSRIYNRR